ncbi:MAG: hypothetical protein WCC60_07100 [Ilumatobacteraceae bacterium]
MTSGQLPKLCLVGSVTLQDGCEVVSAEAGRWVHQAVDGSLVGLARAIHASLGSRSRFETQCSVLLTDRKFRQTGLSGRKLHEFDGPLQKLIDRDDLLDVLVGTVLHHQAQVFEVLAVWRDRPSVSRVTVELFNDLRETWAALASDAAFEWMWSMVSNFAVSGGELGWQHTPNGDAEVLLNPLLPAHPSPFVRGYRTIVYLPLELVEVLGGQERVLAEAPVERTRPVVRGGLPAGVVALLARDPQALTTERLAAWREYLLPVFTLAPESQGPEGWEADSLPLDCLQQDWPGDVDRSADVAADG